jgi:hypothetical protein
MFAYFYQVCIVVFLLQGISLPFLLIISGVLAWRQNQQLEGLRKKLPVVPVFEGQLGGSETASCQACGGDIEYGKGDFACMCSYCNVENFCVQFVRRERTRAERQTTETKSVLFGAMEILDDFVGTFFILSVFLVGCPIPKERSAAERKRVAMKR